MKRYVRNLQLVDTPEAVTEYKKIHNAVWPEIVEGIHSVGISSMDIYLLGNFAVMILEVEDNIDIDEAMTLLGTLPGQQEWEKYVSRFQKCQINDTSSEKWKQMELIFSLPD